MRRGQKLGKYRLERRIGSGSFAEVWRARDTVEQRPVALKVATPAHVAAHGKAEIQREAQIASQLVHPNVALVRNADWIGDHFVIVTDLAEKSLAQYAGAKRSAAVALRVIRDMAAGLAYAHGRHILHRDLKPENILIYRDGHAALADFGVAKYTQGPVGAFTEAGTLGYMAPEQAYGRPRFESDVFSLALIGYELLAGKLPTWPFEEPLAGQRRFEERTPQQVARVLRKGIRLDADRRQRDGTLFFRELSRALVSASPKRAPKRRRPRKTVEATPFEIEAKLFRRRHGKALGLAFDCFRCGGPIAEAMVFCPWCGTRDNSFVEVTSYPLVCPNCERGVRAEWTSCPWCHRGRFEGNGRKPRPDALAERNCSRRGCDGELRAFMRFCPRCGERSKRVWSHPELPDRCQRCRGPSHHLFWRFCPWCGSRGARGSGSTVRRSVTSR